MAMPSWLKKTLGWIAAVVGGIVAIGIALSGLIKKAGSILTPTAASDINKMADQVVDAVDKTDKAIEEANVKKEKLAKETDKEVIDNHLSDATKDKIEDIKKNAIADAIAKAKELSAKNGG